MRGFFLFFLFLCTGYFLYTQDAQNNEETIPEKETQIEDEEILSEETLRTLNEEAMPEEELQVADEKAPPEEAPQTTNEEAASEEELHPEEKEKKEPNLWKGRRFQRNFELSMFQFDIGFSNSYISTSTLIKEITDFFRWGTEFSFNPMSMDNDLLADLIFFFQPFKIKKQTKSKIELEFWTNLDTKFYIDMAKSTMKSIHMIKDSINDPASININNLHGEASAAGYIFFELGVSAGKTIANDKLWICASPSVYFPFVYIKKETISLKGYDSTQSGNGFMGIEGTGEINMYMPFNFEAADPSLIFSCGGLDFSINTIYAAFTYLDVGMNIEHIPLFPANLKYRSTAGLDINLKVPDPNSPHWTPNEILNLDTDDIKLDFTWILETSKKVNHYIIRPIRFNFFSRIKPFNSYLVIIRPSAGFSVNTILSLWTLNYGLSGELNLPYVFSVKLGTECFEEIYNQYIALELDYYNFQIDFGISMQGPDFIDSWKGKGLGLWAAFKFGY